MDLDIQTWLQESEETGEVEEKASSIASPNAISCQQGQSED
jgi:hypothetical protein